jgi:hypothetical protein
MSEKEIREYMSQMGRKGGKRRLATMTKQQRIDSARAAAKARWAKQKGGTR